MNFTQILEKITDYDKTPIVLIDYSGSTSSFMNFYSSKQIKPIFNYKKNIINNNKKDKKPKENESIQEKDIKPKENETIIINNYDDKNLNELFVYFKIICEQKFKKIKSLEINKDINNKKVYINKLTEDTKLSQVS
jgi:hypothetical protein